MTSKEPLQNKGVHKKVADELQRRQNKDNPPREKLSNLQVHNAEIRSYNSSKASLN